MTIKLARKTGTRSQHGFSMLDVLVAIIVLATGLLALAALQGAITRNGANARARSQIAAFTESVTDRMRFAGYNTVVPSTVIPNNTVITPSTACSGALTLLQTLACDANTAQSAAGVSNLKTTVAGSEWFGTDSGSTFGSTDVGGQAAYKEVTTTTTWTDATGQAQSVSFQTMADKVSLSTTNNALANQSFNITLGGAPVVREANPGNTAGVIPIAISSSQNAAATNPAPLVTNTGTTFSTITYVNTTNPLGGNQITQRIDTKVLRCTCKFKASGGVVTNDSDLTAILTQPYGPTYWDGTKYVVPTQLTSSTSKTGIDKTASQDTDCDICCRDRNDVAGNTVLFDNYSGGDFAKYQYSSGVLAAVTSGAFVQTCRMIRVEGIYDAATDIRNYFFGILDTEPCSTAGALNSPKDPVTTNLCTSATAETSAVPTSTATTNYRSFVTDYLFNSLSSLGAGNGPYVAPTTPLANDAAATLYNGTYSLNTPTSITLATTNDTRFLHARGLYIDHLESKAQQAVANGVLNCSGSTEADLINCGVYSTIPFTTVNMTEVAYWSASAANIITTPINASVGGVGYNPSRGYVYAKTSTSNGTVFDIATANQLNSGLTGITSNAATTNTDSLLSLVDKKQFVVNGSGGGGTSVYFDVVLAGLSWLSTGDLSLDPSVSWNGSAAQLGTAVTTKQAVSFLNSGTVTYGGDAVTTCTTSPTKCTTVNYPSAAPWTTPATTPVGLTLTVQGFNTCQGQKLDKNGNPTACVLGATGAGSETITCGGSNPISIQFDKATQCYNYQVDYGNIKIGNNNANVPVGNVSLLGGTTDGGQLEGAVITLPASPGLSSATNTVGGADVISIPFTQQGNATIPTGKCTCNKSSGCGKNNTNYVPGTCSN